MMEKREFYINGEWVVPAKANDFTVIDPSTEEPCAIIALGDAADTNAAVAAAKAAFPDWAFVPKSEKMALLKRLLEIYNDRAEEMAQAMSMEMGAPIEMSRNNQLALGYGTLKGSLKLLKRSNLNAIAHRLKNTCMNRSAFVR